MKSYAGWFCFVLLLGVVIGFAAGKSDVAAQSVDNKSTRWLAGTVSYGQWQDAFLLFDSQTHRLSAYTVTPTKKLELITVREVTWDLKPVMWGKQEPTVQEMKDAYEKSLKETPEKDGKIGDGEKK